VRALPVVVIAADLGSNVPASEVRSAAWALTDEGSVLVEAFAGCAEASSAELRPAVDGSDL